MFIGDQWRDHNRLQETSSRWGYYKSLDVYLILKLKLQHVMCCKLKPAVMLMPGLMLQNTFNSVKCLKQWQTVSSRCTHLPPLPVVPPHPAVAVPAVLDPVPLGELVAHPVGVAALGAHQSDEVQRAQIHLEVLFEAVWLRHDVRTPGPITVSIIQVESEGREERGGGGGKETGCEMCGRSAGAWKCGGRDRCKRKRHVGIRENWNLINLPRIIWFYWVCNFMRTSSPTLW